MKNIFAKKNNKNENHHFGGETSKYGRFVFFGFLLFIFFVTPIITSAAAIKNASKNGLVGYWSFNEGVGTQAGDASGLKNNGVLVNNPSWLAGKIGRALGFDGATSYVSVPNSASLNPVNVTVSAWAKSNTSTWNNYGFIVSKRNVYIIHPTQNATSVLFYIYTTVWTAISCTPSTPITNWNLYTMTWNGTNLTAYINGAQCNTSVVAGPINTSSTDELNIGKDFGQARYFNGAMDDVRIYNRALTSSEILDLYKVGGGSSVKTIASSKTGLVGYWQMNEGVGARVDDASGNKNSSSLVGSPTWVSGKFGKALNFNGTSSYIDTPAMSFLGQASATFTVSVWVKPRVVGGTIIHNRNDSTGWSTGLIGFHGGKLSYNLYANGFADSPNTAKAGEWLFVTFTRDGSSGVNTLYENGVPVKTTTTGYSPSGGSHKFTLGRFVADCCQMDSPGWFDGVMDDYRLYNRALTASEVSDLYKFGGQVTLNASKNNILAEGLFGLWSFDGKDMNWATNKALDRSGQGKDSLLVNMSTTSSPVIGRIGQGLNFDGINDYIDVGSNVVNNDMSMSMWIKPHSLTGYLATDGVINSGIRLILYFSSGGKITWSCYNGGYKIATTNSAIPLNEWTHVVGTIKSNETGGVKIYVNGEVQAITDTTTACGSYGSLYLGAYIWPISNYYNGVMDDVRVYNRNLSASEVKQLYNSGR